MQGSCRDGVEVRVREEGLAFQYPERITGRALRWLVPAEIHRPQRWMHKGRRGEGNEYRSRGIEKRAVWHCEENAWMWKKGSRGEEQKREDFKKETTI